MRPKILSRTVRRRLSALRTLLLACGLVLLASWGVMGSSGNRAAGQEAVPAGDPFRVRVPAPSLDGGTEWFNTQGPLDIKDLRGKFVILDFWTYCCINCMHILPELKKLEDKYPGNVVVIGVHSAKFDEEKESKNIREAILRYEIAHPVVNDANHTIWNNYEVQSWPSLRLIDPEGNLVAAHSGEIEFAALDPVMTAAIDAYRAKGVLDETPLRFDIEKTKVKPTPLRFPGKVLADEKSGRLFIADSNHNRIVVADLDGKLLATIGSGAIGHADGNFATAEFNHPQGMALDGNLLYVADTENHLIRAVDLKKKTVTNIAGIGRQARGPWPGIDPNDRDAPLPRRFVGPAAETAISSPWDLLVHKGDLYIAMAGPHQIWKLSLEDGEIGPYAGNGREDIVDGRLLPRSPYGTPSSSFAQPSGLATDGTSLFVADSEGSSIRSVPFATNQEVKTVVGTAHLPYGRLFAFGDVDGKGDDVRLQHVLGVAFHRGTLYLADTYNNKIKRVDVVKKTVDTIAGTGEAGAEDSPARFDEPGGISAAGSKLYVADTNNHAIRVIDIDHDFDVKTLNVAGLEPPNPPPRPEAEARAFAGGTEVELKVATVQPQAKTLRLKVELKLPPGFKINPDAPMKYRIDPVAKSGPVDRTALSKAERVDPPSMTPEIVVPLSTDTGSDSIKVSLVYFYCQSSERGICKQGTVSWTVPFDLSATAKEKSLALPLEVK